MEPIRQWTRRPSFVIWFILIVVGICTMGIWIDRLSRGSSLARMIDISDLGPGTSRSIEIGGFQANLSVSEGEGFSLGTMQVGIPELGFVSPSIERDGSPESVWIADVNGDGVEDAVFVIRSVGSGSYAGIIVLESVGRTFQWRGLPKINLVPGYMGHGEVEVRSRIIRCSFPTYIDHRSARLDRQWKLEDGLSGELPIKKGQDSNANPSGGTEKLQFDYAAQLWKKD